MNPNQVAEYLEYYNRWRRGETIQQPHPTELGRKNHHETKHICNILTKKI